MYFVPPAASWTGRGGAPVATVAGLPALRISPFPRISEDDQTRSHLIGLLLPLKMIFPSSGTWLAFQHSLSTLNSSSFRTTFTRGVDMSARAFYHSQACPPAPLSPFTNQSEQFACRIADGVSDYVSVRSQNSTRTHPIKTMGVASFRCGDRPRATFGDAGFKRTAAGRNRGWSSMAIKRPAVTHRSNGIAGTGSSS
jgi:hypothetical protein